jgi:hypothetical protein
VLITAAVKLFGVSWSIACGIGLIGFILFAYIINILRDIILNRVVMQTYYDEMEYLRRQMVATVSCSYCGKLNGVGFRMDQRNEFECEHCHKNNLLSITASTAQITTPLTEVAELVNKKI